MITDLSARIQTLIENERVSLAGLARAAGVSFSRLDGVNTNEWAPSEETAQALRDYLDRRETGGAVATPEELINEVRNGRMYILVDDENPENEGALIIPAQLATPDAINFMATHGRGLICLALTQERVEQLGLQRMVKGEGARHDAAFTVSIEAKEGITTGISTADRAQTVAYAIDVSRDASDIVTPGHVFPLAARPGGVLVRAGRTEAAVDLSRLAGLNPSAVFCRIMSDDGGMARLGDLTEFARLHGLKIGTIRDLIAYRRRYDRLIERRSETSFQSIWGGEWKAIAFHHQTAQAEQLVLQKGTVVPTEPTLVRMHVLSPLPDLFGEAGERRLLLQRSMELIGERGAGIIVVLGASIEAAWRDLSSVLTSDYKAEELDTLRDYGVGAEILAELGVNDMTLLTNSNPSLVALDGYGLSVIGRQPIGNGG
jgi:3,4-dihydroxy 2-butanone 4-phosphate synthase/GTP cyclohydrolase II